MKTEAAASRVARCTERMQEQGIDVLLLTKPANMRYLTADGRLCAFGMITRQGTVALAGVGIGDLESTMHGYLKEAGHGDHIFGPPLHGVGIEFEEAPVPAGHAFFHGEKEPPPLPENVVVSIGNCGLYLGPWGVRVEDTVAIGKDGPDLLTSFPKELEP